MSGVEQAKVTALLPDLAAGTLVLEEVRAFVAALAHLPADTYVRFSGGGVFSRPYTGGLLEVVEQIGDNT